MIVAVHALRPMSVLEDTELPVYAVTIKTLAGRPGYVRFLTHANPLRNGPWWWVEPDEYTIVPDDEVPAHVWAALAKYRLTEGEK